MSDMQSHLAIALASIDCFTDDGTLDIAEVDKLMSIALADNHVDDDERRVLAGIFNRIASDDVTEEVWNRIEEFRAAFSI